LSGIMHAKTEEAMEIEENPEDQKEAVPPTDPDLITLEDLKEHCRFIERCEQSKEPRSVGRVLRALGSTKKLLSASVLIRLVNQVFTAPSSAKTRIDLLRLLQVESEPQTEVGSIASPLKVKKTFGMMPSSIGSLPQVEAYIYLLVLVFLMKENKHEEAFTCSMNLVLLVQQHSRRSLDPFAAKAYYYYCLINERKGNLPNLIGPLMKRLQSATLHHEVESQAVLTNCLLRAYILQNMYDMAEKLHSKTAFPEDARTSEVARYFYYLGKIQRVRWCLVVLLFCWFISLFHLFSGRVKAIEADYCLAENHFRLALRKCPQHTAAGFRRSVQKFLITVELLLGDSPQRQIFRQEIFKKALMPYKGLAQAVRIGGLDMFDETLEKHKCTFAKDQTLALIIRLRPNVVKTAVRRIALAYSCINFTDIEHMLGLSNALDAEYVMAKAVEEGLIDAEVNHEKGFLQSREVYDLYATIEPQNQFHTRINFCLELYNQAMKAMRFPPKSYNSIETAEEKREREQQELEFAKELAEEDDEDDEDEY
ncbi:26S proteasome non-ATPase regulatory subunit 3, partial [Trichinella papuae]